MTEGWLAGSPQKSPSALCSDDFSETLWARDQRQLLKESPATARTASAAAKTVPKKPPVVPGFRPQERVRVAEGMKALNSARMEAQTPRSPSKASLDGLTSFLEMNKLNGKCCRDYAIAFAAKGVSDISQLLALPPPQVDELISAAGMDAMDEIFLREALRSDEVPSDDEPPQGRSLTWTPSTISLGAGPWDDEDVDQRA